jgi:hypothetical protein
MADFRHSTGTVHRYEYCNLISNRPPTKPNVLPTGAGGSLGWLAAHQDEGAVSAVRSDGEPAGP